MPVARSGILPPVPRPSSFSQRPRNIAGAPDPALPPVRRRGARRRLAGVAGVVAAGLLATACNGGAAKPTAQQQASSSLSQGLAAQRAGNLGLAASDYRKVLKEQPKNAYALYDLGTVYQSRHQDAAAATQYRAALAADPKFTSAMFNLAILETASNPAQAAALYRKVLKLVPNEAGAHYNLGAILRKQGNLAAARAQYEAAHRLDAALKVPAGLASKAASHNAAGTTRGTTGKGRTPTTSGATTTT